MKALSLVLDYFNQGGMVSYFLLFIYLVITYIVGYRISVLYRGRKIDVRKLYSHKEEAPGSVQSEFLNRISTINKQTEDKEGLIDWHIMDTYQHIHKYSSVLSAAVLLAPLLGLLGTVMGMIEVFSSLSDAELFSSTGGVAGGISVALITTQFGLLVAIPGVFISRFLNKVEKKTYMDTLQIKELFLHDNRVKS
jgi:biopolymer transport protein ExbB